MQIKDIVSLSGQMTNPVSNVSYHLYSLPSFDDNQTREEVSGSEIQSGKFIVPNKCILFNKLNVRFKRVWIIDNLDSNKVCSTEFLPLVVDESKVDFYYCYYLLISDSITNYLTKQNSNTSGSHKRIDPTDFLNINISLPPLSEQKKVGLFLHRLDSKISLNRSINKELEQMAKEIYDYWFVQFDFPDENGRPYKSYGGAMVYNPILKREIPKGWEVATLNDLGTFRNGINYAKGDIGDKDYRIVNVRNVTASSLYLNTDDLDIINLKSSSANRYIVCSNDILVTRSGSPGATRIIQYLSDLPIIFCGFIICFSLYDEKLKPIITYHLKGLESITKEQSGGSILSNISQDVLKSLYVVIPPKSIIETFNEKTLRTWTLIDSIISQTNELTRNRDELLPLLMTGQVKIE